VLSPTFFPALDGDAADDKRSSSTGGGGTGVLMWPGCGVISTGTPFIGLQLVKEAKLTRKAMSLRRIMAVGYRVIQVKKNKKIPVTPAFKT